MRCAICGITVGSIDEAIEQGWCPYFYEGDKQFEPACPNCSEALLQMSEDGEMEVRDEYRGKMKYRDQPRDQGQHLMVGMILSKKDDHNKN
jgi:hypothetical protein